MAELVFLEVLDAHGKVQERHRLAHFPVTVGRDYHNHVILDDDTVSPLHLSIQLGDNGLYVIDCDSENGSWSGERRIQQAPLRDELMLRLGECELRLRTPHANLGPTRPLDTVRLPQPRINRVWLFLLLFTLTLALAGFDGYWNSFQPRALPDILNASWPLLVGLPVWAALWGTLGRVFTGRALFFAHGTIATLAVLSSVLLQIGHILLSYSFNLPQLADWLSFIAVGLGLALLVYLHLRLASRLRIRTLRWIGSAAAFILWGGWIMFSYAASLTPSDTLDVDTTLLPPGLHLTADQSLDGFLKDSEQLKQQLDEDAQQP